MLQQTLPPRIAARVLARFVVRMLGGPGSGNFGHAGRPGEVGGSASVPSGILTAIQQADGGFTYHAVTGETPTSGFALSLHKDRERIVDASKVDLVTLATYARDNDDLLRQPGNYMGGWNNPEDGKVYLDVSTVVSSEDEAQELGARANQLAFFDLKQGKSIPVVRKSSVKAASAIRDGSDDWFTVARRFGRARAKDDRTRTHEGRNRTGSTDFGRTRELGGPGSGHFDHAGRPGEVGGSLPSGGSGIEIELPDPEELARDRADTSGFPHVHPDDATQLDKPGSVVEYYSQGGFMGEVNPLLRRHKGDLSRIKKFSAQSIRELDAEMEPLKEDTTLYRILGTHRANLEEGDEFVDHGFMSTTRDKEALETIVDDIGLPEEYSQIRIRAPKGTLAVDVNKKISKGHMYSHQKELVLARGTKFRVQSVYESKSPPPEKVIEVRVIQ